MLNLDELSADELDDFILKAEQDPISLSKEYFPNENSKRVRAINLLLKYAQFRKEMLRQTSKGRFKEANKHKEKSEAVYRTLPDFSKWDSVDY